MFSNIIMAVRVPPRSVDYSRLLPLGVRGVSKMRQFNANNGTDFTAVNNVIRIPLNTTGMLDGQHSYLQFDLQIAVGQNAANTIAIQSLAPEMFCVDGDGQAVIRRLRIEGSDGAELERIDAYNVLHSAMKHLQTGFDDHSSSQLNALEHSVLTNKGGARISNQIALAGVANCGKSGGSPFPGAPGCPFVGPGNGGADATGVGPGVNHAMPGRGDPPQRGEGTFVSSYVCADAVGGQDNVWTKRYCVKLMSGLLNNSKYVPVGFVAGGGIVLELTLDTDVNCLVTNGTFGNGLGGAGYRVRNVSYNAQIVEMDTQFNQAFRAMLAEQGGIQWHAQTWRQHTYNIADAGTANIPITERAKSIKSLFTVLRPGDQFRQEQPTISNRSFNGQLLGPLGNIPAGQAGARDNLNSVQWKIGSNVYPSQPLTQSEEYYAELVKAMTSLGDTRNSTSMTEQNFSQGYRSFLRTRTLAAAGISANDPDYASTLATIAQSPGFVYRDNAATIALGATCAFNTRRLMDRSLGFLGIDLETYAQATDLLESGLDTSTLALPIELQLRWNSAPCGGAVNTTMHADTFALVDAIFTLDPQGLISVSV